MSWDYEVYGERIAGMYDDLYEEAFDKAAAVTFLEERARGVEPRGEGRALELAIGTGRVAIPLAQKGVAVSGIDISPAMVEKLRAKPGGEAIEVTMGDIADVGVIGSFDLVFVVFNSLFAIDNQEDQVRLFRNVADRLSDQGVFVVEAFVPDLTRFERHQNTEVNDVTVDSANISLSRHDAATQNIRSLHVFLSDEGVKTVPVKLRYIWPSEMDLMAKLAGLELRERYSSWNRDHFTSESKSHISVYGKA